MPNLTITCSKCGKTIPNNLAFRTSSLFIPSGYIPFCTDCLCELIDMGILLKWTNYSNMPIGLLILLNGFYYVKVALRRKQFLKPITA